VTPVKVGSGARKLAARLLDSPEGLAYTTRVPGQVDWTQGFSLAMAWLFHLAVRMLLGTAALAAALDAFRLARPVSDWRRALAAVALATTAGLCCVPLTRPDLSLERDLASRAETRGEYAAAAAHLRVITALADDPEVDRRLARALVRDGRHAEAIGVLHGTWQHGNPRWPADELLCAMAHQRLGDEAGADAHFRRYIPGPTTGTARSPVAPGRPSRER
jgi:hypothetical protein